MQSSTELLESMDNWRTSGRNSSAYSQTLVDYFWKKLHGIFFFDDSEQVETIQKRQELTEWLRRWRWVADMTLCEAYGVTSTNALRRATAFANLRTGSGFQSHPLVLPLYDGGFYSQACASSEFTPRTHTPRPGCQLSLKEKQRKRGTLE